MNSPSLKNLLVLVLVVVVLSMASAQDGTPTSDKRGTLVVLITRDDVERTPAQDAYIEAHTFNANWKSEKSFHFEMVKAGRYEAMLPPGVYDVFVSEPTSSPRCRRVLVTEGHAGYWTLMLEHDDVYLER